MIDFRNFGLPPAPQHDRRDLAAPALHAHAFIAVPADDTDFELLSADCVAELLRKLQEECEGGAP
jgi:hypothetical protein